MFVRPEHRNNIKVAEQPEDLISIMDAYEPVQIKKWIEDIREESAKN